MSLIVKICFVFLSILLTSNLLNAQGLSVRKFAVAPFDNITGNASDEWIGTGFVETLETEIHNAQKLVATDTVTGSPNANVFTNSDENDNQPTNAFFTSARQLGIDLLLTGSYQRVGDQLRITARLHDVKAGTTVHAFRIDGSYGELFDLQDQLISDIKTVVGVPDSVIINNDNLAPVNNVERSTTTGGLVLGEPTSRASSEPGNIGGGFSINGRPTVRVVRTDTPPNIDGLLDDITWRDAALITNFTQTNPVEGAQPTEDTEVRIAYDDEHIYFSFYARYSDPSQMRANRVDRDQIRRDDWIAVMFDTFRDQQRAYRFSVNPYGVQGDAILTSGRRRFGAPGSGGDDSWDALFETGGTIVSDGWTAEMAIPFKSLRYPSVGEGQHNWGFQISRAMQTKDESVVWSPMTRNIAGLMTQMGLINGMDGLSVSRNLEILPTATAIQLGQLTDTGFKEGDASPDLGLNIKYGVTSNLTADFTANPDFSQIESDRPQIEVNQRFPLFFPELRPFFLEGQEIFETPGRINLVHTRTIVDPEFGAKLTGKTGKTTLGLLFTNDEAPGRLDDPTEPAFGQNGQVFIGRARYDLHTESYLGAIVTDREFFNSYSRTAGIDGRIRMGQTHSAQFVAVASDNRTLDGATKSGPMYDIGFRRDARHLNYRLQYNVIDPDFDTQTGFIRRVDTRRLDTDVEYNWWPEHWLISWGPGFSYLRNVDHAGVLQDEDFRADVSLRFARNIFVRADGRQEMERYRGVNFHKKRFRINNSINSSRRFSVFYGFNWGDQVRFVENPFLGRFFDYNLGLTVRPTSRLNTRLDINTSRFRNTTTDLLEFNVKILRKLTTYQFTDRFLVRNILEYNTDSGAVGINVLLTYRVNAGTVFYIGYDDRLKEVTNFNDERFLVTELQRQRRAFFTKFQYLFRY
ncbi:MAG TPA: hypothetical protein EYO94_01360 [Acidobacteria bacterium]|nr:hypothetical protein [Acidobacteriota bacterium]